MENDGGRLNFSAGIDLTALRKDADECLRILNGIGSDAQKAGRTIDGAFSSGAAALEDAYKDASRRIGDTFDQLDAMAGANAREIESLKERYAELGEAAGGAYSKAYGGTGYRTDEQQQIAAQIKVRQSLTAEIGRTSEALAEEEQSLNREYESLKKAGEAHGSMRSQLRQMVQQLAEMEEQGLRGTEAYERLREECGRLTNAMADAQQQAKILAHDNQGLQGVISAVSGVSGAFSAAQGAIGLFASQNENLVKIQTKVQSLMAITMGLQQAANTLNKDSYFRVVLLTKAQKLFSAATTKTAAALTGFGVSAAAANVAAKALVGTLTLGLSVAVTAAVAVMDKLISKQKEARKAQEEFNKAVVDSTVEPVASIMRMSEEWRTLGDDMEAKRKYVEDNTKAFDDLGLSIKNVADAESLLTSPDQLEKFVEAQMRKAEAAAYLQQVEEKIRKKIELQRQLDSMPEGIDVLQWNAETRQMEKTGTRPNPFKGEDSQIRKAIAQIDEEIGAGYRQWAETREKGDNMMKELGGEEAGDAAEDGKNAAEAYLEGSIGAVRQRISELNEELNKVTTDGERQALQQQIADQQELLSELTKTAADELAEREEAYRKSGETLADLMASNAKMEIEVMDDGMAKEYAAIKARKEQRLAELEETRRKLVELNRTSGVATVGDTGLTETQNKEYDRSRGLIEEQYRQGQKAVLDGILGDILTYEQKRQKIEEEYAQRRRDLYEEDGTTLKEGVEQGNVDELDSQAREALEAVDEEFAMKEETYRDWCEELAAMTLDALKETLDQARDELAEAQGSGMSGNKLAAAQAKVTKAQKEYEKAVKAANKEEEDGAKKTGRSVEEWNALRESLNDCASAFSELGDEIGGTVGEALSAVGQVTSKTVSMINSIVQLTQGSVAAMETASVAGVTAIKAVESASVILTVISAVVQIATTIAGLFDQNAKIQEEIDALQDRIDRLQWELDNMDVVRFERRFGDIFESVTQTVIDATGAVKEYYKTINQDDPNMYARDTYTFLPEISASLPGIALVDAGLNKILNDLIFISGQAYGYHNVAVNALKDTEKTQKAVDALAKSISGVGYSAGKAVGEAKYDLRDTVENYAEQILLLEAEIEEENNKRRKKRDDDQIEADIEQIEELYMEGAQEIADAFEDIIGGSAEDIASTLSDAFFDAFEAGEDAAEAWGDSVDEIVGNMIRQLFVAKYLEEPMNKLFDKYSDLWLGDSVTDLDEISQSWSDLRDDLNALEEDFEQNWDGFSDVFGDLFESTREASSKGIATASQESVDELNGRATAIQGHTYTISEGTKELVATTNLILQSIVNIEGDTSSMEGSLSYLRGAVDEINSKGVRIRTS